MAVDSEHLIRLFKPTAAISFIVGLWLAYLFSIALYRLRFHPLARFPGPKLAALSKWYEFYYEVVLKGQFVFNIDVMHEKYGTFVSQYDLHILTSKRPNCSNHAR